jgi:hypothetical protein
MDTDTIFGNCLCEMGRRVGLEWDTVEDAEAFAEEFGGEWYRARTWTRAQEEEFRGWMNDYLRKSGRFIWKSPRRRKNDVAMFLLCWGWVTEREPES